MLSFSIVINTLNRSDFLVNTLESFKWLKYQGFFEVVVVNGPSADNTEQLLSAWADKIRVGKCDIANLSVSRNIGICMAQGDIVAFVDDDAIPEPEWLTQLAEAYEDEEVGGAGGLVYNHTGYAYQYEFSTANRIGNANFSAGKNKGQYCYPCMFEFPYLQGTNASFRRSALLEIGGFDEEIEFYLDETDVCCRLVDAGHIIKQLENAFVHHKFAPSTIRDDYKILRNRYPVIKNKVYFSLKHGRSYWPLSKIQDDNLDFIERLAEDMTWHISEGRLDESEKVRFDDEVERALKVGLARGLSNSFELIGPEKLKRWHGEYRPFASLLKPERCRVVVMISRYFPPDHERGAAIVYRDLAEAIAAEGHIIHIITQSPDINRVDFENGVWVHRMVVEQAEPTAEVLEKKIPQHIWDWSTTALKETERISTHRLIDVVEVPNRDCEGVAFLGVCRWPVVVNVWTTLQGWLEDHPEKKNDSEWMSSRGNPMLALEKKILQQADVVRLMRDALQDEIASEYDFIFDEKKNTSERMARESHGLYSLAVEKFAGEKK